MRASTGYGSTVRWISSRFLADSWPKELREQVAAVRDLVTSDARAARSWTSEDVARAFKSSRRNDVASVLEALAALGILLAFDTAEGRRWRAA